MSDKHTPHPIFTPTAITAERLDEATVGRDELIDRVSERVRDAARSGARRHTLLVGSRGSGKTHTLTVATHRALADPRVAAAVAVAWIPEDSLSIDSYRDLLVEMARALDPALTERAQALRRARDAVGLERLIEGYAGSRTVVVVVENLDRVFRALGRADTGGLRGFVETSGRILVLASAPLLFSGISSRDEPWYGSFDVEHLQELSVEEGAEIVRRRAAARGNPELAAYVTSDEGRARLRAIAHLAGGSPRLWQILAEAVTITALDELVPAVEKLLDDLAPYYQQRLWELGGIDQKLVVELGRASGALTVTDLAEVTGVEARAAATALGRLSDASWVRSAKSVGGDRRKSWYELREPLLRHHLQYRDSHGEPLRVIVKVLRGWYSVRDRRRQLAWAQTDSVAESFLAATMLDDPPGRSDSAYADRDVDELMAEARSWRLGTSTSAVQGSPQLARRIETLVADVRQREASAPAEAVGNALETLLRDDWNTSDRRSLELITTCWNGEKNPQAAVARLSALRQDDDASHFDLAVRDELAFWTGEAGDPAGARDQLAALLPDRIRVQGPAPPHPLPPRHNLAYRTGEAGDAASARDQLAALLPDRIRVQGPDHPHTLTTRHNLAHWAGEAGDAAGARDQLAALIPDRIRVLGPDHPHTLATRQNLAYTTGEAGDPASARDQLTALLPDQIRVLGADHPHTLTTRHNLAYTTGEAGDPASARDQLAALLADRIRVLGPDHPHTLNTRSILATLTFDAGLPLSTVGWTPGQGLAWAVAFASSRRLEPTQAAALAGQLMGLLGVSSTVELISLTQLLQPVVMGGRAKWLAAYRDAGGVTDEMTEALAAALDGDPEARMRLPQELRRLIDELAVKGSAHG